MTNKEKFIEEIEYYIEEGKTKFTAFRLSDEAMAYFESLKKDKGHSKAITENGIKILQFMQENWKNRNNIFKAAEIGEGLFMSGRSVSGSMRKLVADGYVVKEGKDPVCYSITEAGKSFELTN